MPSSIKNFHSIKFKKLWTLAKKFSLTKLSLFFLPIFPTLFRPHLLMKSSIFFVQSNSKTY